MSVDIDDGRAIGEIVWVDSFARSPEMYSATKDARERERLESFAIPRTPLNQCGPASIASNTSQYSGSARGSQPKARWHLSSLLLRIPGWVPPGHVEGKEHAHDAALLS